MYVSRCNVLEYVAAEHVSSVCLALLRTRIAGVWIPAGITASLEQR